VHFVVAIMGEEINTKRIDTTADLYKNKKRNRLQLANCQQAIVAHKISAYN
jgi:hypothetical protein